MEGHHHSRLDLGWRLCRALVGTGLLALLGIAASSPAAQADSSVYVTNSLNNNVSVIDTASNTAIVAVPVGANPHGVAAAPDGTHVYVTNSDSSSVSVIDTATNTVTATIGVGNSPRGVVVSPDGRFVYVANQGYSSVSVIHTASNTVRANVRAS